MKTKIKLLNQIAASCRSRRNLIATMLLPLCLQSGGTVQAANIAWATTASQWTNTTAWVGGVVPGINDNAIFDTNIINANENITVNVNPLNTLLAGSITVGNTIGSSFRIAAQSSAVNPTTLYLNGVGGIFISNTSSYYQLFITNASASPYNPLYIGISNSGAIYCNNGSTFTPPSDGGGGEIVAYDAINGPGSITKTGGGILLFNAANGYSGSTTLAAGTLEVAGAATIGNGTGPVYLEGGNLECGGNSTSRVISNSITVNTSGNAYIYNKSGTPGTRVFILGGNLVGTQGTLVIGNADTGQTSNEVFDVQLTGTFSFGLPLVVGDPSGTDGFSDNPPTYTSEMQLANTTSTGTQTFGGNISGDGQIIRGSLGNVPVSGTGTTIFTGNNTYTGGTLIDQGTLLANNTSGSALGTGNVTVTNTGILGGTGTVNSGAAVSVYLGGTIQPGASSTSVGNLNLGSGLTFNPGANYTWQMASASGTAGTAWDLITCANGWTDAGSISSTPITINVTSQGVPTGWNSSASYSWIIISNNGSNPNFNAGDWSVNATGFGGTIAGTFSVSSDPNGDLVLNYTPTSGNIVINVPSGSVTQGAVTPTNYPVITGLDTVTKVGNGEVILTNSLNSYSGATYIDAGTASAAVDSTTAGGAFGASTAPLVLGYTSGNSNATLNIDQPGVSVDNAVNIAAGSSGTKTIGTTITSGLATYSGDVTLNDNVTLSTASGGSDDFEGNFSGVGGITLTGGGTNTLDGLGTYSGPTTLVSGTLNLDSSAIGTNLFTIDPNVALDNTGGGAVTLANNPPQLWNGNFIFNGSGNLNLGAGPVTMATNITVSASNSVLTVGGTVSGTGLGLTLIGPGELLLNGATNNTYTGGTTNLGGILAINATTTFGDGSGPLVFEGAAGTTNYLLDFSSRSGLAISNPVVMDTSLRIYGNSTVTTSGQQTRVFPLAGPFTVAGGSTLYIDDTGAGTTIFNLRLFATNSSTSFTNINWPIVVGDPTFDSPNTTCQLDLQNDNSTPPQIVSGLISGTGQLLRSAPTLNTGGTTILTQQNTFSGGVTLVDGTIGLGASSITNDSGVVSGPLGTGEFTFGAQTAGENNLTVFGLVSPTTEIDNALFFNGDTNMAFAGTNNLLFTGALNSGGVAKFITVTNGITVTLAGPISNAGSSTAGALTLNGGGTLVLSGTDTYAGNTTVNVGTLLLNGSLQSSNVIVNSGGTFGGKGNMANGVLFNSSAQAYLFKSAGSPDSPLTVGGDLTINSNTVDVDLGGTTTLAAGTYTLLNYSGTLSGSFNPVPVIVDGSLASGTTATIDFSTPSQVNLIVSNSVVIAAPGFSNNGIVRLPTGNFSLTATGLVNASYRLWATTNLALTPVTNTWTLIGSGTVTSTPFTNFDLGATNYSKRFYLFTSP